MKDIRNHHYELKGHHNGICLYGDIEIKLCESLPVKCHSIQEHRILDKMCDDKLEVYTYDFKDKYPNAREAYLKTVKIADASTFYGLCSKHDNEVFRLLDTNPFEYNNPYMITLITYRTILYSYTKYMEIASKCQLEFQERANGDENYVDSLGMFVILPLAHCYQFFQAKLDIENVLIKKEFDNLYYRCKVISRCMNIFTTSYTYYASFNKNQIKFLNVYVCINYFVENDTGYLIVSGMKQYRDMIDYTFESMIKETDTKWMKINNIIRYSLFFSNNFYFNKKIVKESDLLTRLDFFNKHNASHLIFSSFGSTDDLF